MTTPYSNPDFDGTVGHDGTAFLFPVSLRGSDPDLAMAVNSLFFDDESRWPSIALGGSLVPLATTMVDCPDANNVVNWLAWGETNLFVGINLPTLADVTHDDAAGTVPYVNPALSSNPDAIYALNYLLDNDPRKWG